MSAPLAVTDVAKRYGALRVLDGVDLEVPTGVTGLLGPNGAGKTTLLRVLASILPPDRGTVTFDGRALTTQSDRVAYRRGLGYLPQETGFPTRFTVHDFVEYLALLKEIDDPRTRAAEITRVLEAVGLEGRRSTRIRKLSGGMRRRLALAQALLGEPCVLLLDEPTTGLDPEQRVRLRSLISDHGRDRAVLLSTHQTEDVASLCQRVIVLTDGRVRYEGDVPGLAAHARGRVWVSAAPQPDAMASWLTSDGHHRHIGTPPSGAELVTPTVEEGYLALLRMEVAAAG